MIHLKKFWLMGAWLLVANVAFGQSLSSNNRLSCSAWQEPVVKLSDGLAEAQVRTCIFSGTSFQEAWRALAQQSILRDASLFPTLPMSNAKKSKMIDSTDDITEKIQY